MMRFRLETTRRLHDEHRETIALLERLESTLGRHKQGTPPAADDGAVAALLSDLVAGLETEVDVHFRFEEEHLFPRLAAIGEANIGAFLASEHEAIATVARMTVALARAARGKGFEAAPWREFHGLGGELVERVVSHIQKEEMALLPMVEDLLGPHEDSELSAAYAMAH